MSHNLEDADLKTRFCPSPTGLMHLGNTRTALFNYLLAHRSDGHFLLRIEDTDVERSKEEYTQALQEDLAWLQLNWDEGPQHGGDLGPYHQSGRQAIYADYYQRLEEMRLCYPCFCSEEELAIARKIQRASGKPPRYPLTCRDLTTEQIEEKLAQGLKPTLRFRVPIDEIVSFNDMVRGEQKFLTSDISDFIIRRANGTAPFMYCNAIDDALMQVTHVLRGEDHVTNTPRQIMILKSLGLPIPTYGHIALIVGADGSPLSKRHGSKNVQELRNEGFLPLAINNYLARLGHYYGHDDLLSLEELAEQFKIESLAKSPAKFNVEQLIYWQKTAVAHLDDAYLLEWVDVEIRKEIPDASRDLFIETVRPNVTFPEEANHWARVIFIDLPAINEPQARILETAGQDYFNVAIAAVAEHINDFSQIMAHIKSDLGLKGKALYQPLRIALTAAEHGPELAKIVQLMNEQEIQRRLEAAR